MKRKILLHLILSLILVRVCSSLALAYTFNRSNNTVRLSGGITMLSSSLAPITRNEGKKDDKKTTLAQSNGYKSHRDLVPGIKNSVDPSQQMPFNTNGKRPPAAQFAGDPSKMGHCDGGCSTGLDRKIIDKMNKKIDKDFARQVKGIDNFKISYSGLKLLLNQNAKDRAYELAVKYGTESLRNYVLAKRLKERARILGSGVKKPPQFYEFNPVFTEEILLIACQASPLLPQCANDFVPQDKSFGRGGKGGGDHRVQRPSKNMIYTRPVIRLSKRRPAAKGRLNPFKKLFKKKEKNLNFDLKKSVIQDRNIDIFSRISDRYEAVNVTGNRLIKYRVK